MVFLCFSCSSQWNASQAFQLLMRHDFALDLHYYNTCSNLINSNGKALPCIYVYANYCTRGCFKSFFLTWMLLMVIFSYTLLTVCNILEVSIGSLTSHTVSHFPTVCQRYSLGEIQCFPTAFWRCSCQYRYSAIYHSGTNSNVYTWPKWYASPPVRFPLYALPRCAWALSYSTDLVFTIQA